MKKYFLILIVAITAACNQNVEEQNMALQAELDSLKMEQASRDSTITEFAESFGTIQNNLAEIREREESIREARSGNIENMPDAKQQVLDDIQAINELIEENKRAMKNLNARIGSKDSKIGSLNRVIADLNGQIEAKSNQITLLKEDLASANFRLEQLNTKVGTLTEEKMAQKQTIEEQRDAMNAAYYAIGDADALEDNKVIDKEGGFIGLGKTKTLADDFNREYFTRIDLTKTDLIPFERIDKVKLITPHASSSYEWVMEGDMYTGLKIKNREEFWKSTKYLVILLD